MKLKLCEIVTKVENLEKLTDDLSLFLDKIGMVKDYAFIIHDKDIKDDGTLKDPHYHIVLRLKDSYDTKHICQWFDLGENFISKCKGRFSDMLKYLTHKNSPSKYQYDDSAVISNYDWKEERNKSTNSSSLRLEEIVNDIVDMKYREYNIGEYLSNLEQVRYARQINEAYKLRDRKILDRGAYGMECVFITGSAGAGKTTMAKKMAEDKGYAYYVSGSSNDPLEGYRGQECLILDDLRGSAFSFADLLKILDNNTRSMSKSRYRNKVLQCELIIITSVVPMEEFYSNVFEGAEEPLVQLKRRCKTYIKMTKEVVSMSVFDPSKDDYGLTLNMPNEIIKEFQNNAMSPEEEFERMIQFLPDVMRLNKDLLMEQFKLQKEVGIQQVYGKHPF